MLTLGRRGLYLLTAMLVALGSMPGAAWAIELEILGDMTSPHGGFGAYQNLLLRSEQLDNAAWTVTNTITRTADQTPVAPDGSTTADKLSFGGAGTVDSLAQDSGIVSTTDAYTFSVWLRSVSGGTTVVLKIEDLNESNTTVVTGLSSTVWERYSVSATFATAGGNIVVTILENSAADAPVVLAWGSQLEKAAKANVYTRSVGASVSSSAPSYGLALGKDLYTSGSLTAMGTIQTGVNGQDGQLKVYSEQGATDYSVVFNPHTTMTGNVVYTLPADDGTANQVLATDGSGALSWVSSLTNSLTSANIFVGNGSNIATSVAMSGDVTIDNTGATTIGADKVALLTDTTGNYVTSITNGSGIAGGNGGSEGAALTLSLGALTGDWSQTGAFDISLGNAGSELKILESAGATYYGIFDVGDLAAADATYTFSGASGTVLTSTNHTATLDGVYVNEGQADSITSAMITNGEIVNIDIGASAAIAFSKLAALTSGNILVGNGSNVATSVAMSGDITIANTGATTIGPSKVLSSMINDGEIVNADVGAAAAIAGTKISPNFGSQAVVTTGTLAAGATSITGNTSIRTGDKYIMDSDDSSDTYATHNTTNDRVDLVVDGVVVARFKK